jgi:hypothetical protein
MTTHVVRNFSKTTLEHGGNGIAAIDTIKRPSSDENLTERGVVGIKGA